MNELRTIELRILGHIVRNRQKGGWFHQGSLYLSQVVNLPKEEVQEILQNLINRNFLETGPPGEGARTIPLRLTEHANSRRIKLFYEMFPDIRNALLTKR